MPNDFAVTLDVRNFPSSGSDGYTNATASNGAVYSYLYAGGSGGKGNVDVTNGSGHAAITVSIISDPRYNISNINFNNDLANQFSWHAGGNAKVAVITDANSASAEVKYTCIVTDSTANCTIPCDPMIKNVPPTK